jgi:hypothetical protein
MCGMEYTIEVTGIRRQGEYVKARLTTKASSAQMAIIQTAGIDSKAIQWEPNSLADAKGTYYDDVTIIGYKWYVK